MTYPTAFSIELGETITASLANRLSFTGELTDSRAFICDGHDDCNAPLTCANFKTTKNERKNNPYFTEGARKANNHSESCSYLVKKSNSSNTNKETSSQVKQSKKLKLILGKDGFKKPQPRKQTHNTLSPQSNSSLTATYSVNSNGDKERKYSKSHVKTLRTLVEVFQSGEYDLDNTKLETLDSLSLNELFHSLDTPSTLSYQFRVYFGQAKIFEKDPDKPITS
ncbi:hypothetical protein [Bacillus sp. JCM 19041]|uniref:hypothetical protein n=1 Tax=Bacillus sp. JCM 19041 TaxID=1460637 RepID=UPI0006D0AEB6